MRRIHLVLAAIGFWLVATAKSGDLMPWDPALARAFTYKDLRTSITFYSILRAFLNSANVIAPWPFEQAQR